MLLRARLGTGGIATSAQFHRRNQRGEEGSDQETTRGLPSPDCRASYEQFATAPTFGELKAKLLRVPMVHTMRRVGADADHAKLSVSLLDRNSVVLMALELQRVDDGRWIAEVMTQGCQ